MAVKKQSRLNYFFKIITIMYTFWYSSEHKIRIPHLVFFEEKILLNFIYLHRKQTTLIFLSKTI